MPGKTYRLLLLALAFAAVLPAARAEEPLAVSVKRLTLETAERIARAAVEACRAEGIQVAATVVDRGGHPQAVLRDTLAPDITLAVSRQKAYTAYSFNAPLSTLEDRFTAPFSVGKVEGLVFSAGGVPIAVGGILYGGVGVSGAPSGEQDERCASAGLAAVRDDLEMAGM